SPGAGPDFSGNAAAPAAGATGLNPLNAAAATLFSLVGRIRNRAQHANPEALRESVIAEIRAFESRALQAGVAPQTVKIARYAICATIDDVVLNTPWGGQSIWSMQSMVSTFHKNTIGGDAFYDILQRLEQEPGKNRTLLEFIYVCMTLGFEGRLRVENRGAEKLMSLRDSLARLIRNQRGPLERDLAVRWKGLELAHRPLSAWAPIWLITGLTAGVLCLSFFGFSYALSGDTGNLRGQLNGLAGAGPVELARAAPPPPPVVVELPPEEDTEAKLREFLAPEIQEELVEVFQLGNAITVRIAGSNMFASASDQLTSRYQPLVDRVAEAMNQEDGPIIIAGHSDNVPIRTARFPNNTALSLARAKSVMTRMADQIAEDGRMTAEGRAEKEPIAPNATAEGRAKNRRIEVILIEMD
ncbi:MAG: type IVB secretion system protein IcmH/DotU, partial [Pseudomonadota bacterium]